MTGQAWGPADAARSSLIGLSVGEASGPMLDSLGRVFTGWSTDRHWLAPTWA